jgi:tetratricopeptide (TPR) repeat protein
VTGMIDMKYNMFFELGVSSYNEKKYDQAMMMFFQAYDVKNMVNLDAGDAKKNALISLQQITEKLTSGDKPDFKSAIFLVEQVRTQFPEDIDLLITMINIHLRNNDLVSAEKYMAEAVSLDPNNKVLHYNLGTSYMTQGQNEKAEQSLNKALEIDPTYKDAQYQLGAHLYNWANDVNKEAGELNSNDPKVAELEKKSTELLNKSIVVLEKYIEINPTDKDVLGIIYKTYYKLGNSEKGKAYKARYDASDVIYPEPPYGTPSNTTKSNSGDVKSITYFYNCYKNKYVSVTFTKVGNNSDWEKSEVESTPCQN